MKFVVLLFHNKTAMNLQEIFTARLKDARKRRKMSQEALGVAIGLDESVASTRINRYEKGIHQPDFITLAKIAEVLQVPPAYLLADDNLAAWLLAHCTEDENA